jgi:hypothetical protein
MKSQTDTITYKTFIYLIEMIIYFHPTLLGKQLNSRISQSIDCNIDVNI